MRRFIASLPGKVLSHIVISALMVPYFALGIAARGNAQVGPGKPIWAVVDFTNRKGNNAYGTEAAKAVASRLEVSQKYEITDMGTVTRIVEQLGLTQPMSNRSNLLAVGAELKASTVVSGEIVDYRVDKSAAGKQARVSMRVVAYDVASREPVNGAAVSAFSTVRSGDVTDEVLINDAIAQAAGEAVGRINQQTLPSGTVLNTTPERALLNQGTRTGFKDGMQVIISRGREQVASGVVFDVSADKSFLRITRSFKGIQPGDKVRAVFDVPNTVPGWNTDGTPQVKVERKKSANSGLITTLLIVGLIALLAFGSEGRNNSVTEDVVAEAFDDPTNGASIKVSWTPNGFAKGNQFRQLWQVFRNDQGSVIPVRTSPGGEIFAFDNVVPAASITYSGLPNSNNFSICNTGFNQITSTGLANGVIPGRPYQYSVNLVFSMSPNDLPGGSNGGGGGGVNAGGATAGGATAGGATAGGATAGGATAGGATAGGATAGGATAGGATAGGTAGTGAVNNACFFLSSRTAAPGFATALNRPSLVSPPAGQVLQNPQTFSFNSVRNAAFPITLEYVIQISSTIDFRAGTYIQRVAKTTSSGDTSAILATEPIDMNDTSLPASLLTSTNLFWRIGAKNTVDSPGPVPDSLTQKRYIFSTVNQLTRPSAPPPPPSL